MQIKINHICAQRLLDTKTLEAIAACTVDLDSAKSGDCVAVCPGYYIPEDRTTVSEHTSVSFYFKTETGFQYKCYSKMIDEDHPNRLAFADAYIRLLRDATAYESLSGSVEKMRIHDDETIHVKAFVTKDVIALVPDDNVDQADRTPEGCVTEGNIGYFANLVLPHLSTPHAKVEHYPKIESFMSMLNALVKLHNGTGERITLLSPDL